MEEVKGAPTKFVDWDKSMLPTGSYLLLEGDLHGDLHGVITGTGVGRRARRRFPRRMPPMID